MANVTKPILLNETGVSIKEQLEALVQKAIVLQGPKGDDGKGISKIEKTATEGLIDTYTITFTDSTTTTFMVTNGTNGTNGDDGISPHIDETSGHWFVGDDDTGVVAKGDKGDPGMTQDEIETYIANYIDTHYDKADEGSY